SVPVYGTRLTCGLINNKLKEHKLLRTTKLHEVRYGDVIELGCFSVEIIRSNHSIPDACALCIRTPLGNIIHTGDFKIDPTPIDGEMMDLARLGEIGKEGVLALISDSTNAERPGHTNSERTVGAALDHIFAVTDKRIIVTTFASNIHRVKQIIDAAEKHGRKVAVSGRSMVNNVKAAIELGVIEVAEESMVDIAKIKNYRPDQLVIVTTGSQGEPLSALYRMAFADHKNVAIGENDLVIISASPVPGNEEMVSNVINELMRRGAEVITNKQADIHVSGHASQEEQKLVIGLTKPCYFLPMHGEMRHMAAHAKTAQAMGVEPEKIILTEIGKVVELSENGWRFAGTVPAGQVMIDGSGVGDVGNVVLKDRQNLAQNGVVVASAAIERGTGRLLGRPELQTRGFVYVKESAELLRDLCSVAEEALLRCYDGGVSSPEVLRNELCDVLSSAVFRRTKRTPIVLATILECDTRR
ncbi:MAG: ribonuclease J, partial [Clostridia bacterium]|nr:ribonuclease J [Clostridia bacterium]